MTLSCQAEASSRYFMGQVMSPPAAKWRGITAIIRCIDRATVRDQHEHPHFQHIDGSD